MHVQVEDMPVFGVAIPTLKGVTNVLDYIGTCTGTALVHGANESSFAALGVLLARGGSHQWLGVESYLLWLNQATELSCMSVNLFSTVQQ